MKIYARLNLPTLEQKLQFILDKLIKNDVRILLIPSSDYIKYMLIKYEDLSKRPTVRRSMNSIGATCNKRLDEVTDMIRFHENWEGWQQAFTIIKNLHS